MQVLETQYTVTVFESFSTASGATLALTLCLLLK